MPGEYQFDNRPRNIFRFALALWRVLQDSNNTKEAAIVELTFSRSNWGKKLARWNTVVDELVAAHPEVGEAVQSRQKLEPVDLQALIKLPGNTLGHQLAAFELQRNYDPNLVEPVPITSNGEWLMNHLYETHDFWHVVTGFNFDLKGEIGVGGVYLAQLPNAPFFGFMTAIILAKVVWKHPDQHGEIISALVEGYQIGKRCKPLIGLRWETLWETDLDELRSQLGIDEAGQFESPAWAA